MPTSWTVAGGWRTLTTLAIADMWKVLPVVTLIFLAGLESIPEDVYEAADVDGAARWQRFLRVTLPLLMPYVTMAVILRAIDAFRIFELALVMAGRVEPVLGTFIWSRYGPPTSDPFTAAAGAIVLFARDHGVHRALPPADRRPGGAGAVRLALRRLGFDRPEIVVVDSCWCCSRSISSSWCRSRRGTPSSASVPTSSSPSRPSGSGSASSPGGICGAPFSRA